MEILEKIGDSLVGTMPEVSDHAIAEHDAQQRKNDANAQTDTPAPDAPAFNPETHEISTKTGKVIKKRRGGSASKVAGVPAQPAAVVNSNTETQARASGKFAAAALVGVCVGIFGDEFRPEKSAGIDEHAYLEGAFGDYFVATGRTDIPPNIALVIALGAYVVPRLTRPKTQSKLGAMRDFVVSKFFAWRGKKALKQAEKTAGE